MKLNVRSMPNASGAETAFGATRSEDAALDTSNAPAVTVVLPCLNEAETVAMCVAEALTALKQSGIDGEVLVVDNGSTDNSAELAARAGARVVHESRRGYGSALRRGAEEACGEYVVMADADGSYDLSDIPRFVGELRDGADLVMGSRLRGKIERGAMPWLHRRIGNPLLSGILNVMFKSRVSDAHCGMRAFTKSAFRRMKASSLGMEFASEMVVKASLAGMRIVDIPVTLRPDRRSLHGPHLRPFRDGWRHLRFMLLLSPTHVFLLPAALCVGTGLLALFAPAFGPIRIGGLSFDYHYMLLGSLLTILGFQVLMTGFFAKAYCHAARLGRDDWILDIVKRYFSLERGLISGTILFAGGFAIFIKIFAAWLASGMGELNAIRPATMASTLMIIGAQIVFSSFFLSMLLSLPSESSKD
jgi:glycosyltransferase involved in cell wall biosynthesis